MSSFYFRGSWSDSPTAPNRGVTWSSPDVLAIGVTELNPSELNNICVATYSNASQDPTLNIVNTTTNYCYLRGYNTSSTALATVQFKLYAMPFSAGMPDPSIWIPVMPVAGSWVPSGTPNICQVSNVPPGPYVCPVPFQWLQSANVTASHYCFMAIAAVISNGETFPDNNTIKNNPNYIQQNYNCVQRNIGWNGNDPNINVQARVTLNVSTSTTLNPGYLRIRVEQFPVGWEVAFESDSPDSSGQRLVMPRTKVNSATGLTSWMVGGTFNAGWSSNVEYFVWRNGIAPSGSPAIMTDLVSISSTSGGNIAEAINESPDKLIVVKPNMMGALHAQTGACIRFG